MPSKAKQPVLCEERLTPFNCPACGSNKEIVKTYGNGKKQVLECANCHTDKDKYIRKQLTPNLDTWQDSKLCSDCGSKKRYVQIENGSNVTRCAKCDAIIKTNQDNKEQKQCCPYCGSDEIIISDKDDIAFECANCHKPVE